MANKLTNQLKWKYTFITTFILLLVMNPYSFNITNNFINVVINNNFTYMGILIHTFIFTLLLRLQM